VQRDLRESHFVASNRLEEIDLLKLRLVDLHQQVERGEVVVRQLEHASQTHLKMTMKTDRHKMETDRHKML
jgi:hypothetical protein